MAAQLRSPLSWALEWWRKVPHTDARDPRSTHSAAVAPAVKMAAKRATIGRRVRGMLSCKKMCLQFDLGMPLRKHQKMTACIRLGAKY